MSQIVTSKVTVIKNLELAKRIAIENGFRLTENQISGIGNKQVDYAFEKNGINFGLLKNDAGNYEIRYDDSFAKKVNNSFLSKYLKENLKIQAHLSGNSCEISSETDTEISLDINVN